MSNIAKFLMLFCIGLVLAAGSIWFVGGKKKEFDVSREVNVRASLIFPFVSQPNLKKEWMEGLVEQELIEGDSIKEGSRMRTVLESNGESTEFHDLIIRYAVDEIISIKSRSNSMSSTFLFKLKEVGGKTKVNYRRIIKYAGIERFKSVFSENDYQREVERDLNNLIELLETKYPNGAGASVERPRAAVETSVDNSEETADGSALKEEAGADAQEDESSTN